MESWRIELRIMMEIFVVDIGLNCNFLQKFSKCYIAKNSNSRISIIAKFCNNIVLQNNDKVEKFDKNSIALNGTAEMENIKIFAIIYQGLKYLFLKNFYEC